MEQTRFTERRTVVAEYLIKEDWFEKVKRIHTYFSWQEVAANWEKVPKIIEIENGEQIIKGEYQDVKVTIEILD